MNYLLKNIYFFSLRCQSVLDDSDHNGNPYFIGGFFSHDVLFLPGPLLPSIYSCRISCSNSYLWPFLMKCSRYSSFRILIISKMSFPFPSLSSTAWLVTWTQHHIVAQKRHNISEVSLQSVFQARIELWVVHLSCYYLFYWFSCILFFWR